MSNLLSRLECYKEALGIVESEATSREDSPDLFTYEKVFHEMQLKRGIPDYEIHFGTIIEISPVNRYPDVKEESDLPYLLPRIYMSNAIKNLALAEKNGFFGDWNESVMFLATAVMERAQEEFKQLSLDTIPGLKGLHGFIKKRTTSYKIPSENLPIDEVCLLTLKYVSGQATDEEVSECFRMTIGSSKTGQDERWKTEKDELLEYGAEARIFFKFIRIMHEDRPNQTMGEMLDFLREKLQINPTDFSSQSYTKLFHPEEGEKTELKREISLGDARLYGQRVLSFKG
jgi:hypothetical protein